MSLIRRAKGQTLERYYTSPNFPTPTSGAVVGVTSALRSTAVWACVRLLSETVASLPLHNFADTGKKRVLLDPPAWVVKPNAEMTRFELIERTMAALNLDGNAYWYYERDRLGRVAEVWPIPPGNVQVFRDVASKQVRYRVDRDVFTSDHVVHFKAFAGVDPLKGLSPIGMFAQSIGLGLAAESYGAQFFANGAAPGGVIETPETVTREQLTDMARLWDENHRGSANVNRPGFLTGGAKWQSTTIPNDQAQFLEARNFQVTEVARIFRVQPHMIADLSHSTYSNIENEAISFVVHSVRAWLVRLEQALVPLIPEGSYVKFNVDALLRGDTLSRYQAHAIAIQNHWMNSDEVRDLEDMDPIPDGEGQVFYGPLNNAPLGMAPVVAGGVPAAAPKSLDELTEIAALLSPTIHVAAPNVKVMPAQVHFKAPDVNVTVEPAQVNVGDVHVDAPQIELSVAPKTKTLTYDDAGNIASITES